MKRVIPIIIVCLLVALAAIAQRGPAGPMALPPPPPNGEALAEYLGLSDGQKTAADAIESDFRAQVEAARKASDAKLEALLTPEQKAKFEAFQAAMKSLRRRGPGGEAHR